MQSTTGKANNRFLDAAADRNYENNNNDILEANIDPMATSNRATARTIATNKIESNLNNNGSQEFDFESRQTDEDTALPMNHMKLVEREPTPWEKLADAVFSVTHDKLRNKSTASSK